MARALAGGFGAQYLRGAVPIWPGERIGTREVGGDAGVVPAVRVGSGSAGGRPGGVSLVDVDSGDGERKDVAGEVLAVMARGLAGGFGAQHGRGVGGDGP